MHEIFKCSHCGAEHEEELDLLTCYECGCDTCDACSECWVGETVCEGCYDDLLEEEEEDDEEDL